MAIKKRYANKLEKMIEDLDNAVYVVEENGKQVVDTRNPNLPINQLANKLENRYTQPIQQSSKKQEKSTWFSKGDFDDGFDLLDIPKVILGTVGDVGLNVVHGVGSLAEGLVDLGAYGVSGASRLVGNDKLADRLKERASMNAMDELLGSAHDFLDKHSILGEKTDNIGQGLGQVGGIILTGGVGASAGLGTAGVTALTTGVTGLSSMGSGMGEAYQGGATDEEALTYGAITGTAEAVTELIFGGLGKAVNAVGLSKGLSSLDDAFAKKVSSKISNQIAKNFVEYGIKAGAEGTEEVLSGIMQAAGKKMTYMSEEDWEQIIKDEHLLDQFIMGTVTSGFAQSGIVPGMKQGSLIEANKTGRDFVTGYTQNEQKIIDSIVNEKTNEIAKQKTIDNTLNKAIESKETEQGGILSTKEKNAIRERILAQIDSGEIDISKTKVSNKEISKIRESVEEQMQKGLLDTNTIESILPNTDLSKDSFLQKSYLEKARKSETFTYDNEITDTKEKAVYDSASKYFNNTTRSHEFVEKVAKIAKERGTNYAFINNEELKSLGHDVEGKQVNGLVRTNKDGEQTVLINIDSPKALNTIVGHETTHLLEGTQEYQDLQEAIFNYAKEKGDFEARQKSLSKLYEGIDNANIDSEITADLVGDYLFTDDKFINSLSTQKPTLFQKIKDLIDDLVIKFKGTKEEKQLREVQKKFKEAYKQSTSNFNDPVASIKNAQKTEKTVQKVEKQEKKAPKIAKKEQITPVKEQITETEEIDIDEDILPETQEQNNISKEWTDKVNEQDKVNRPLAIEQAKATGNNTMVGYSPILSNYKLYSKGSLSWVTPEGKINTKVVDETKIDEFLSKNKIDRLNNGINPFENGLSNQVKENDIAPTINDEFKALTKDDLPILEQQRQEDFKHIKDSDSPVEQEIDIPDIEEITSTKSLFDTRDYAEVGDRKVNAYQYDNPEVKPYFQEAALSMLDDLSMSNKGERFITGDISQIGTSDYEFTGIKRNTTPDIEDLLDGVDGHYKLSYEEIRKGLNAIIEDKGSENNQASKRIEFYLDKRLREGFTTIDGIDIPANQKYINLLKAKEFDEYYSSLPIEDTELETKQYSLTKATDEQISRAEALENQNKTAEEIYLKTGAYRGADGKWRSEIDDSNSKILLDVAYLDRSERHVYKLEQILDHPELYKAYPGLKRLNVEFKDIGDYNGRYDPNSNTFEINTNLYNQNEDSPRRMEKFLKQIEENDPVISLLYSENELKVLEKKYREALKNSDSTLYQNNLKSTLMHEIQHFIQEQEGFAKGTNLEEKQRATQKYNEVLREKDGELSEYYEKIGVSDWIKENMPRLQNGEITIDQFFEEQTEFKHNSEYGKEIKKLQEEYKEYQNRYKVFARDPYDLYKNTAGEIEAREVQKRLNYTKEQRQNEMPFVKDDKTVYAEPTLNRRYGIIPPSNSITQYSISDTELKQQQLDIVLKNNPVEDDYHTWIRTVEDIKTFEETLQDSDWEDWEETGFDPDYDADMVKEALKTGKITVYSSYPIEQGIFVSPSKMEAESYSGNGKVYSKEVNLKDVAWIDPTQGQYAKVSNTQYSLTDNQGRELSKEQQDYFKNSKVRDENGNLKVMYHGTSKGGHTTFDTYGGEFGLFGQGSYFTDNKSVAEEYTNKGRGNNKQVYETYLNITNPMDMDAPADYQEWSKAFPDVDFAQNGTNEDFFKTLKEYFQDNDYPKWEAGEEAWYGITEMGYDGLTHIGGRRFNKADDTRHRVYIAYESNQIKNIDNLNPTSDNDIRYSLSDNQGRTLTKNQQEFFKDSKVRDEIGNLEVVYHSTPNNFTVFDNKMLGENTGYENTGFGTFVTTNKAFSERFKDIDNEGNEGYTMELYANATNPIIHPYLSHLKYGNEKANEIVENYYKALGNTEALEYLQEYVDDGDAESIYDAYMYIAGMEQSVFDYAYNERKVLEEAGYDAVELIEGREKKLVDGSENEDVISSYAIFNSNQLKNIDNTNPTTNNDIRYQLSNPNEEIAPIGDYNVYGKDIKLSPLDKEIESLVADLQNFSKKTPDRKTFEERVIQSAKEIEKELGYMPKNPTKESSYNEEQKEIAKILVEEPKTQKQRNARKWAIFRASIFDKGTPFEDLSLKTRNRELMGKWDYTLTSEARGQNIIGKGHFEDGIQTSKSLNDIRAEVDNTGLTKEFYEYMYHKHNVDRMKVNKPVFGDNVTSEMSQQIVNQYELQHPEFIDFAQDVYDYVNADRRLLVKQGIITQETADLWTEMYPKYVPIRRANQDGNAINVPLDTNRTGVNAPIKRATGGSSDILPLFDTMAMRTLQTQRAIAKNNFGVELKNTLGTTIESSKTDLESFVDSLENSLENQEGLLQEGKDGKNPTFTVFENGNKVTFEITRDMYDALKPVSERLSKTVKPLNIASKFHKGVITEYNPVFMLTNSIKDVQEIIINSQHAVKTYATIPEATAQLLNKGYWYQEYVNNGGEQNSYFDNETNTFDTKKNVLLDSKLSPLKWISTINNTIEMAPRLAEYIASRKSGRSIEVSMLDAARVTTNFKAGGDVTKALNRNGATFLNASVQGAMQQVRNFREANANGLKGWVNLATKFAVAGLTSRVLNDLLWSDDDEYEDLSDYVKQNYYIVAKDDDGTFIRIPKGRTVAVIQESINQMSNLITGDDEVDLKNFIDLAITNLAPNNPIDNNILSPILQVASNKAWYGGDLVPSRLQDLPNAEQYDESTDKFSRWLGEKTGWSPYKINYLLNQYTGGVGDVVLPMITPEKKNKADSLGEYLTAPFKDKFTTNATMNNQNISDFYDISEELTKKANSSKATDKDVLSNKYINSVKSEMNELYQEKREVQNSNLPNSKKYNKVLDIQAQINELAEEALSQFSNVSSASNYSTVGDREYYKNINEDGEIEWTKVREEEAEDLEVLGLTKSEKNTYFKVRDEIKSIDDDSNTKKTDIIDAIKGTGFSDEQKAYLYKKYYNTDTVDIMVSSGINIDDYFEYAKQEFVADKDENGKSISGSRKDKVISYVNSLDLSIPQKAILIKSTNTFKFNDYNDNIIDYVNELDITYEEKTALLEELDMKVDANGNISWE